MKKYLPWVLRGAVLLVVLLFAWALNSAHSSKEQLSKELEREKIEKANLLAERDATKKELKRLEDELFKANPDLKAENDRLKKLLDEKPKIVEIVKWKTKVVEVPSQPADVPGRDCPPPGPDGKPSKDILLLAGDKGHVEVAEVTYETREGNRVILGKGFCYRDEPTPVLLFSSVIEAPVSSAYVPPTVEEPRWGAGAFVGLAKGGWTLGPKLMFPPLKLWGFRAEAEAGVALGPSGEYVGMAGIGVRW
jgi:cell division protein FtsB